MNNNKLIIVIIVILILTLPYAFLRANFLIKNYAPPIILVNYIQLFGIKDEGDEIAMNSALGNFPISSFNMLRSCAYSGKGHFEDCGETKFRFFNIFKQIGYIKKGGLSGDLIIFNRENINIFSPGYVYDTGNKKWGNATTSLINLKLKNNEINFLSAEELSKIIEKNNPNVPPIKIDVKNETITIKYTNDVTSNIYFGCSYKVTESGDIDYLKTY